MLKDLFYFNKIVYRIKDIYYLRRHRKKVKGLSKSFIFNAGDFVKVIYFRKSYAYVFEGLCLGIRNKNFISPNTAFILTNTVLGIKIEIIFAYFSKRLYFLKLLDYKIKFDFINRNKIFFLKVNN